MKVSETVSSCRLQLWIRYIIYQQSWTYFVFRWPCISVQFLLITNLTHFFNVFIYLFPFSTCFEQTSAHHQENQLYQYIIWYVSLCVGDCLVCRSEGTNIPGSHLHKLTYTRWFIDTIRYYWWWTL